MRISCVVPARIGSTRFPAKPLAKICGREMILHTLDRASEAECFDRIICATDSVEISSLVIKNGYESVITPSQCLTGSDRVFHAAEKLNLKSVLNIQGDEPVIDPSVIQSLCDSMQKNPNSWVTAACPLENEFIECKSVVKVAVDNNGFAIDFFRVKKREYSNLYKHKGLYGYSFKSLKEFSSSEQSESEKLLSLEQLRVFPNTKIKVVIVENESHSVDIPQDITIVERIYKEQMNQFV